MSSRRKVGVLAGVLAAALAAAGGLWVATRTTTDPEPVVVADSGSGHLRTSGNRIVDSLGATVRLTGINWFGMETSNHTFHGLWSGNPWRKQIDTMVQLGYNLLRVPYSNDALRPEATATDINEDANPDLVGLSPLEILDKVVDYAGGKGMRVILDRHRPTAAGQTALWYSTAVPEATWIDDWKMLAQRYAGKPAVIGADLHDEPHAAGTTAHPTGACWGCGDLARDWRLAAERAGNAVLAVQPDWLIFVEGVSCLNGGLPDDDKPHGDEACGWWGGNLSRAKSFPVRLDVPDRLVYSPHEYATSVEPQSWFDAPDYPANLPRLWDRHWGYLHKQNVAPVLIGEFGSTLRDPKDRVWLRDLLAYTGSGLDGMSCAYWSWNPNSEDTGGIALDDWTSVDTDKQKMLQPYLIAPVTTTTASAGRRRRRPRG